MLTTIRGYYDKGRIFLQERAPVEDESEVMVTFLPKELFGPKQAPVLRSPGGLKGKVTIPDDFNDPLEDLKDYM